MKILGIAPVLLVQLLLVSNSCSATNANASANAGHSDSNSANTNGLNEILQHPLARLLFARFASSLSSNQEQSTNTLGFLRKLASSSDYSEKTTLEFGPGADWSCTADANRANDYDSCTLTDTDHGSCSWCPLGSSIGVCLGAGQAALVNGLENNSVLHLKCYSHEDEYAGEKDDLEVDANDIATAFWDKALECMPHSMDDCGGDHVGDHTCIYCTVADPAMGLCLSNELWNNMVVAQALEDFESDVSTGDQIRLDQVIHCSEDHGPVDDSLFSQRCGGALVDSVASADECAAQQDCAIVENPFPGLMGSAPGMHCVGAHQAAAIVWALELLKSMGWETSTRN